MKLISLLEFVEQNKFPQTTEEASNESVLIHNFYNKVCAYATFLKQPLTLQMFVPVDKHGVILEDLKFCCSGSDCGCMGQPVNVGSQEEIDEYYEAKDKLLFKNVDLKTANYIVDGFTTIESLTDSKLLNGLELTDSAIKQIGL